LAVQRRSDPEFDARWSGWIARGAERDRRIRRRLTFVLPLSIAFAITFAYVWYTR